MNKNVLCSNLVKIVQTNSLYLFGILNSRTHMCWVKIVAGRLGVGYRYSKDIVYNNFPWPNASQSWKKEIEKTAQEILDARALYPESSLADLYDPLAMPKELKAAHRKNDIAVAKAYGFSQNLSEQQIVERLFALYRRYIDEV